MPEPEDKKLNEEEEKEQEESQEKEPKSKGLLMMIIIGVVLFVVAVGGFSFMLGVFSEAPADEETQTEAVAEEATGKETDADNSDMSNLEANIFGHEKDSGSTDMDDLARLAAEKSGMSIEDSIDAINWLEREKTKLAKERSELDALKKELDNQEYRLKQLIAQSNQIKSTRVSALAKLYDGMKSTQVAPLIGKLNQDQAVQILLRMKPANAAKILGVLNPNLAASISARMITLTEEK